MNEPLFFGFNFSGSVSRVSEEAEEYPQLNGWLPEQFPYRISHYEEGASLGDHPTFDATVRVAVLTVEQAKEWVQKLNLSSGVTWRVEVTRPRLGKRVLFKHSYRCQHRVQMAGRRTKNTGCGAKMVVTLKRRVDGKSKSADPYLPDYPLEVRIQNHHNHNLHVAEALRYRDVGEKAVETLTGLFELGHTPSSALAVLQQDLRMEYREQYVAFRPCHLFHPLPVFMPVLLTQKCLCCLQALIFINDQFLIK